MADQSRLDLKRLDSEDPAVRRAAIAALRESGDSQVVGPLLQVAHTDPDPDLRDLARETAYALGKSALSVDAGAAPPPLTPDSVIRPIAPPPRRVTGREKRVGRRRLN